MDSENWEILHGLKKIKYYEFIKQALGTKCFFEGPEDEIRTHETENEKDKNSREKKGL